MNSELFEALTLLEKEKNISKDTLLDAIKQSLLQACKNHYGKAEANNVIVNIDPQTCEFEIYAEKKVVDHVLISSRRNLDGLRHRMQKM